MLNSGRSPAACQVEPAASSERSMSTTSDQPFFARWYSVLTPTAPPPITTTRACGLILKCPFPTYVFALAQRSDRSASQSSNCDNRLPNCATESYTFASPARWRSRQGTVKPADSTQTTRFVFLTLVNYSMIAVSNAAEPLRMANRVSGLSAYEWEIATLDGNAVVSSNGLKLEPTYGLNQLRPFDLIFVCGGTDVAGPTPPNTLPTLRRPAPTPVP